MYLYNDFDKQYLLQRIAEFRAQAQRRIDGVLSEEEFKPLRLQNGLYLQLHAYMLRVAIPYGTLNSRQMRQLADIADHFDKGYGHFTTRQNIQFNWIALSDVADILEKLAEVDMHAIQTSGNCIRNVTTDHFAGAHADEVADPRITAELLRQWSTGHPEYAFLPRKFKIAVTASQNDRAVTAFHDIGLQLIATTAGQRGYRIFVGGGLGRTPRIGRELRAFLPEDDLFHYLDAIMSVYNRMGRRDNKYKARIKILIDEWGLDEAREQIEVDFQLRKEKWPGFNKKLKDQITKNFRGPDFTAAGDFNQSQKNALVSASQSNPAFARFLDQNITKHKDKNHVILSISLKAYGAPPGDATSFQMRVLADIAQEFGYDELRVSHEQNIILPHIHKSHLQEIYQRLVAAQLATANIGLVSDIIACPGLDYCALATARSIPIAQALSERFEQRRAEQDIGPLKIKISGCINACGHHHVGHIGILGLDRAGVENYQITIGGDGATDAMLGTRTGPGFSADALLDAIDTIIDVYLANRTDKKETFMAFFKRVGITPFKAALYPEDTHLLSAKLQAAI
jgi:sulfite reductase (NADPH) hemoprotein beta-component